MRAMTDRQKQAVEAYFTVCAKCQQIFAWDLTAVPVTDGTKDEARAVEEAANTLIHDAGGDVAQAFGAGPSSSGNWRAFETALDFLTVRELPNVETLVTTMRELAAANRDAGAWSAWYGMKDDTPARAILREREAA